MGALSHRLNALLTRKVLNVETEHKGTTRPMGHLAGKPGLIAWIVALPQQAEGQAPLGLITDYMDVAEADDAGIIRSVQLGQHLVAAYDRKRGAVIAADASTLCPSIAE